MLKWTGKALAKFSLFLHPSPTQGLPRPRWTPNRGWVPLGVGTPPLPQPPLRGASLGGPAFTFAPPSLPPTPSGLEWLEGASVGRGSGLGSQQVSGGPSEQGKHWPCSLLILCPPNGPQFPPSGVGSLPLPQPPLRGFSPIPPPLLLPLHSPQAPCSTRSVGVPLVPLGVRGPPLLPGRCPSCVETRIPLPPSLPS